MPVILWIPLSIEPKLSSIGKRNEGVVRQFSTLSHGGTYLPNP